MKTFEDEYKSLVQWYFAERDRIEKTAEPWSGGLDGGYTDHVRRLTNEYRKRLDIIRKKYEKKG